MYDLWSFRQHLIGTGELQNLAGYAVETTNGRLGSVDQATAEPGNSHLIISAGLRVRGRKLMLPAGTIKRIDHLARKVYLDRDKDEIKNAPEYTEQLRNDAGYHSQLGDYYGRAGM
jgi:hypothetical protein